MKKIKYYILFILFLMIVYSCHSNKQSVNIPNNLFKIKSIKQQKNSLFIIEATKEGLTYKILSYKDSISFESSKIEVDKYYDLQLELIYPKESAIFNLGIKTVTYGKYKFKIEKKYHYSLYKAMNISGIYLIPTKSQ